MRVGVFIGDYTPRSGGGFTFVDEIIQALSSDLSRHEFRFIAQYGPNPDQPTFLYLNSAKLGLFHRLLSTVNRFWPSMARRLGYRTESDRLNDLINTHQIDCIYYAFPGFVRAQAPAVVTVWDLAHRIYPFFPEVNFSGWKWEDRETFYRDSLPMATALVTGTAEGKRQIMHHFGIHPERIHIVPLPTPSFVLENTEEPDKTDNSRSDPSFLYYPAQFWPHKNHLLLLRALKKLKERGVFLQLVLSGSDQGNQEYIEEAIVSLSLTDSVRIEGFVDRHKIIELYRNCFALVFPSFFGPDNLPPLEAMALGAPVLVADIEGAREQLGDAALYFSPLDEDDLVDLILKILGNNDLLHELRARGRKRAFSWTTREYASSLNDVFDRVQKYRRCWR